MREQVITLFALQAEEKAMLSGRRTELARRRRAAGQQAAANTQIPSAGGPASIAGAQEQQPSTENVRSRLPTVEDIGLGRLSNLLEVYQVRLGNSMLYPAE